MKQIRKIRRNAFPTFEVTKARIVPGGIEVKVKLPNSEASLNWIKMDTRYYFLENKRIQIRKISPGIISQIEGNKVRVPKLEKEHRISIRKQQNEIYRRNKL